MAIGQRPSKSQPALIADAIGVAHFIIAHIVFFVGEHTLLFEQFPSKYPGMQFVFEIIDFPMYLLCRDLLELVQGDVVFTFLVAELIVVASSVLYGAIAFAFMAMLERISF